MAEETCFFCDTPSVRSLLLCPTHEGFTTAAVTRGRNLAIIQKVMALECESCGMSKPDYIARIHSAKIGAHCARCISDPTAIRIRDPEPEVSPDESTWIQPEPKP